MTETATKSLTGSVIRLHPADNVVIARIDVGIGTKIESEGFTSKSQVPTGHKIAATDIAKGAAILKYDTCIGFAAVILRRAPTCILTTSAFKSMTATTHTQNTTSRLPFYRLINKPVLWDMFDLMVK